MKKNPGCKFYQIEKDKIVVNLPESEFNYIEQIGLKEFSNRKGASSLIRMYAVIWLFTKLNLREPFCPINADVFRKSVTTRDYVRYRDALVKNNIIQTKEEEKEVYTDKQGVRHIVTKSPMRYRLILMSYRYSKGIFAEQSSRTIPVNLSFDSLTHQAIKAKIDRITNDYDKYSQGEKIDSLLSISEKEIRILNAVIKLIKDVFYEKVKSISRFDRRLEDIAKLYGINHQRDTINNKKYNLSLLVYNVLLVLYENKNKKKKYEQIGSYIRSNGVENQFVSVRKTRQGRKGKLSYYGDLSIDIDALNHCVRMSDLHHMARINEVPKYHYPDRKLYSQLANLRKVLRKYVRYKDSLLIEVSDIHAAHFTMIPLIFKRSGIVVSDTEMANYKETTQNKDLYSEVVEDTQYTREDIKTVFQPFLSIKNETSFLYNRPVFDREKRELVCNYFKQTFPEIYNGLINYHSNHKLTIKRVANEVESDIMNGICDKIRNSGLHPFRVHDAVYLPDDEYPLLRFDIKQAVFDRINEGSYQIKKHRKQAINRS